jgi:glycerophosphoryl diester phosphodiesterase
LSLRLWHYPFWIAHRGAGTLAPENTLAAFRLGAAHRYRMFECDARLSADDTVFLLHDNTLERTTDGQGIAGQRPWAELAALDAGAWHSAAYQGEGLPLLSTLASWCLTHGGMLNIEIKPTPGTEQRTGQRVAQEAARLWAHAAVPPLLSSFSHAALQAARAAAPQLPRGLLLERFSDEGLDMARSLGCVALIGHHPLWQAERVGRVHAAGLHCLAYTVNDPAEAQRLQALAIDGLITDRVDLFPPD